MKTRITVLLAVGIAVAISGCSKAVGDDASEKRTYVQKMKADTLAELYQEKPETKAKIADAVGYGVFSNININLLLLSSGNGYGIVHETSSGDETYMKMRGFGVGFGAENSVDLDTLNKQIAEIEADVATRVADTHEVDALRSLDTAIHIAGVAGSNVKQLDNVADGRCVEGLQLL